MNMEYNDIIKFHGHECPGLAMGYRMARAALKALKAARSEDEEIVAIVENDACGTDAVQCVTGCTFGKGNLIFKDYGKPVYTLFSRSVGRGVRVVFRGDAVPEKVREDRKALVRYILEAPDTDILSLTDVAMDAPSPARVHASVNCAICGEPVMETRTREVNGQLTCIPCAEERLKAEQPK